MEQIVTILAGIFTSAVHLIGLPGVLAIMICIVGRIIGSGLLLFIGFAALVITFSGTVSNLLHGGSLQSLSGSVVSLLSPVLNFIRSHLPQR